jgi:hypothetical protein
VQSGLHDNPSGTAVTWSKHTGYAAVAIGAAAETAVVAFTTPFTWAADAVVAIALAVLVAAVVIHVLAPSTANPVAPRRPRRRDAEGRPSWGRRWTLWVVPVLATVAWELVTFASSPRATHPTVSSMLDALNSTHLGRAVAFAGWLALGWYVVTR